MAKASLYVRNRNNKGRITDRDTEMVRYAEKYRFINTDHFLVLTGGTYRPITRRLQFLFDNGYLDRPKSQDDRTRQTPAKPTVYALGNKGADLLVEVDGIPRKRVDWTDKNRTIRNFSINHALLATDFFVALRIACETNSNVRLVEQAELEKRLRPEILKLARPFQWKVKAPLPPAGVIQEIGINPDGVFALDFIKEGKRAYFFTEFDRSTMPIESSNPNRSSIIRKFIGYHYTAKQKLHTERFRWRNFRVLFLTISEERAENMRIKQKELLGNRGTPLFMFTNASSVSNGEILIAQWANGLRV